MDSGSLNRAGVVDSEKFFQNYEGMRVELESLRKRYGNIVTAHTATINKLELSQEEVNRLKTLYDEAKQESNSAKRELDSMKNQCSTTLMKWDLALRELNEYKEAFSKLKQQHDEAMQEVNQGMARSIKSSKDIKRLTDERDAAVKEYSLVMGERDSVIRDIEKCHEDLSKAEKQITVLENQNKELLNKVQEAGQEAEVSNRTRDWAFSERDKIMREKESLKTYNESLRRERDSANSKLAKVKSESEDIKRQYNAAVKQLKELKEKMEIEKENRSVRLQYLSASSSFSESRDSAIDSDLPSGHYSIKLPNVRGADHGLVLEPGVYISRIVPGSPASKETNLNIGDRVLFINDNAIDNVQDAILALSEDVDPIMLTLSRSAGHLPISPNHGLMHSKLLNASLVTNNSRISNQASTSSLKSDKSDVNSSNNNVSRSDNRQRSGSGPSLKQGGLRNIFNVKLPRKKVSSAEDEILETLNSAIASGGSSSSAQRKTRRKRASSRGAANDNSNKNGTWPRVILNRNSACSYTLPHNGGIIPSENAPSSLGTRETSDNNSSHYASIIPDHKKSDSSSGFYSGQYTSNPNSSSSTLGIRRSGGKERVPLSALGWDFAQHSVGTSTHSPSNSKSVGAININPNTGFQMQQMHGDSEHAVKGTSTLGRNIRPGYIDSITGLDVHLRDGLHHGQASGINNPQHHRYSFGVFDPSGSHSGGRKSDPHRNSVVVPTLSDGSSLDFSVKSGNMDILEYYVKLNKGKNHNNSSESDHLDKVVTPPSIIGLPNPSVGLSQSGSSSNVYNSPIGISNTLNRFSTHLPSRYSTGHNHNSLLSAPHLPMNLQLTHPSMQHPSTSQTLPHSSISSQHYFEPNFQQSQHSHHALSNKSEIRSASTTPMLLHSGSAKMIYREPDPYDVLHSNTLVEPSGTFPRKREPQRIRIPSNQSVTSRGSMEKFDLRNSPMPPPSYHVERKRKQKRRKKRVLEPGNSGMGGADYGSWHGKPGEIRKIRIEKSSPQLGIQIKEKDKNAGGGIFISSVTKGSIAYQANLRVGFQILEICGINMRSATFTHAAQVLSQCTDTVTLLVQCWPEKYHSLPDKNGSSSDGEFQSDGSSSDNADDNNSSMSDNESRSSGRSDSLTPCNSPQSTLVRNSKKNSSIQNKSSSINTAGNPNAQNSLQSSFKGYHSQQQQTQLQQALANVSLDNHNSAHTTPSGTLTRKSGHHQTSDGDKSLNEQRYITLPLMKSSSNLGISLVGGNVVGIFIHSVQHDSIADRHGLRTGDQILEYNGTNLREATAEEAAFELAKPLEKVNLLLQYNLQRYNEIKDQPGDGFYIRALFEYPALSNDPHHPRGPSDSQALSFHKDEILFVDNTMYNGKPGKWRAWKVDSDGHKQVWGIIPSKFKIEEDLLFKRSVGDLDSSRSSTVARRSFFRRKSHHTSRELASFSDFSINAYGGDSSQHGVQLKEDALLNSTYQRVARLDCLNLKAFRKGLTDMVFLRPVIILGALSDLIGDRLVQDFPYQFGRVQPEMMQCPGAVLEQGLAEGIFVDYKRKSSHYECITMSAIKEISSKKLYCILDVSTSGIERLQRAQMYPIVLMVKFKNFKQIRDIKELRIDKITLKAAKELYEHSLKVENEYKHLITANFNAGANMSLLVTQIKTAVEREQSKTLWVPV